MPSFDLTDVEAAVLRTVHAEGGADHYDVARAVGTGPRTVQEAVRRLSQKDLVHVTGHGRRVQCTRAGNRWVRQRQSPP